MYFRQDYITRKIGLHSGLFVDQGSGSASLLYIGPPCRKTFGYLLQELRNIHRVIKEFKEFIKIVVIH